MPTDLIISTDQSLLNVPWMIEQSQASFLGEKYTSEQLSRAIANSLVFGAYAEGRQVGFIRAVTDNAIFSSILDVFVDEAHRGKGYGTALLKAAVEDPRIGQTRCILRAKGPLWLWYFRQDFHVFDKRSGLMQRMPR
jgi:GNAT superfamily N-acetyltransferase